MVNSMREPDGTRPRPDDLLIEGDEGGQIFAAISVHQDLADVGDRFHEAFDILGGYVLARRRNDQIFLSVRDLQEPIGIDFADEHRVEATGIYLRNTEDEASLTLGHNFNFRRESGQQLRNYRIRYEERELELVQFHGTHRLGPATIELLKPFVNLAFAEGLAFDWYWSDATATTEIPSGAQPAHTPGTSGVVVTNPKLLTQFGGDSFTLNRARYTRHRLAGPEQQPDALAQLIRSFLDDARRAGDERSARSVW